MQFPLKTALPDVPQPEWTGALPYAISLSSLIASITLLFQRKKRICPLKDATRYDCENKEKAFLESQKSLVKKMSKNSKKDFSHPHAFVRSKLVKGPRSKVENKMKRSSMVAEDPRTDLVQKKIRKHDRH